MNAARRAVCNLHINDSSLLQIPPHTHLLSAEHYCDGLLFHAHSGVVAAALTAAVHSLLSETDMGTHPRSLFASKLLFPKYRFLYRVKLIATITLC